MIGRSKLVELPLQDCYRMPMRQSQSVILIQSFPNLKELTNLADILIVAVGKPKIIDAQYVKEGAYVIDVGVNSEVLMVTYVVT